QGAPWEHRSSLPLWRTVPVACLRRRKLVVRRGWLRIVINHYSTSIRKRPVCPRISCPRISVCPRISLPDPPTISLIPLGFGSCLNNESAKQVRKARLPEL